MRSKLKLIAAIAASLPIALTLAACSGLKSLDVVGQYSITSFEEVLKTIPDKIAADELNSGWALSAPDDSARFIWSEDYSLSPARDVCIEFDAQPFLDAGLDPEKLPDYYYTESDETGGVKKLITGLKLGDDKLTYSGSPTALAAYGQIVDKYRKNINYHTELDHFGVMAGNGNMFEWAKDLYTNGTTGENQSLDIVFVLNPEPLVAAGVVPENVKGWTYAPVEMMTDGKKTEIYKFLKPFDIK